MRDLWELYLSKTWVEPFLGWSILLFITASIVLYVLIIKSRSQKLNDEIIEAKRSEIIERLLFSVVFNNVSFSEIKNDTDYQLLCNDRRFRAQLIASVLNLHKNYEGIYAKKLERFYYESGLIKDSFKRMKSQHWEIVCCGVRELAEMNVTKAFESIIKVSRQRNKTLKVVALTACIKLRREKGLSHLMDHKDPLDEWIQINILSAIKLYDIEEIQGIELLFDSDNKTIVSLGLKIVRTMKLSAKAEFIQKLINGNASADIKMEAQQVYNYLTAQHV